MMLRLAKQYNSTAPRSCSRSPRRWAWSSFPARYHDMFGLTRDDLIDALGEPVGAATVIGLMQEGSAPLFI